MANRTEVPRRVRCENDKCRKVVVESLAVWLELNNKTGLYCEPGTVPHKHSQGGFPFCPDCAQQIRALGRLDDGEGTLVIEAHFSACLHVDRAAFNKMGDEDKKSCLVEQLHEMIESSHRCRTASDFPHEYDGSFIDRYKVIEVRSEDDECIMSRCTACDGEGICVHTEDGDGERRIERDTHGKPRVCPVCKGAKLFHGRPE